MANAIKWDAAMTDRGTVLTTELNSLAADAWSTAGSELDNSTNRDEYALVKLAVTFGSAPAATGYVEVYLITAPDGANYDTLDTDNDPRGDRLVTSVAVIDTTSAQLRHSILFALPPTKLKFSVRNRSGQAFPASGSTLRLFTANEAIQ